MHGMNIKQRATQISQQEGGLGHSNASGWTGITPVS
jgi:hypothetical protein